jgi:hypothetical protein
MEDLTLQNLWKEYDRKLEEARLLNLQSWALNKQTFETVQLQKAQNRLNRLKVHKITTIVLGIAWVWFLCMLVFIHISWQGIFFNVSALCIALFNAFAVWVYAKQTVLIYQIDESESILQTQQKLAWLQTSTVRIVGIMWLQLPFYGTLFFNPAMFANGGLLRYAIAIASTGLLTLAAVWLYRNINYRNRHKKWFKLMFNSPSFNYVNRAIAFLDEVEKFKQNG